MGFFRRRAAQALDNRILKPIASDLEPGEAPIFRARAEILSAETGKRRGLADAYITNRYFHFVDAKAGGSTARHRLGALRVVRLHERQVDLLWEVSSDTAAVSPMNIAPASTARMWIEALLQAYEADTGKTFPLDKIMHTPR